jgi:hypothetical protein
MSSLFVLFILLYVDLCMPLWLCNSWFLILDYLSKVIFKISCIISNNIDLPNCEQIFTHLHLNLSGKAFKVGDHHFSSVSDTLNRLIYLRIKTKNLNGKRPSRRYVGRIVTFTFLSRFLRNVSSVTTLNGPWNGPIYSNDDVKQIVGWTPFLTH